MAKTPHRIFAVHRPRRRRGTVRTVVPWRARRQIACEMPSRIATQKRATAEEHDDGKLARGLDAGQAAAGRNGILRRIGKMEVCVVSHDDEYGEMVNLA